MTNGAEEDQNAANEQNAASEQPTEPVQPAQPAEAAPPPPPPGEGAAPAGPPPGNRGAWLIPKWVIAVLLGFVVVAILFGSAFAIGRATASGGESARDDRQTEGRSPREPGERPNLPRVPPQANGVFLGVATQASTDPQGVRIVEVVAGSPAASAGLQADDVITAVDGTPVTRPVELAQQIRSHESGDQVTIAYSRGGNATQTQVTLADRSSESQPNS